MRRTWQIARREYIEHVRSKAFMIGIVVGPLLWGGLAWLSHSAEKQSGPKEVQIAVLDLSKEVYPEMAARAQRHNRFPAARPKYRLEEIPRGERSVEETKAALARRVRAGELTGYLAVEPDAVRGRGWASYATRNATVREIPNDLGRWLDEAAQAARMRTQGLDPKVVAAVTRPIVLQQVTLGEKEGEEKAGGGLGTMITLMVFVMLLVVGIIMICQICLMSLLEEKSSRIVEVILSSVSPYQFMVGKIVGTGLVGLTLLAVWGVGGYGVAAWKGLTEFVALELVGYFAVYFVLGFLLYAATFCALGSLCNSQKEAGNLTGPITILLLVPIYFMQALARDPGGTMAVVLSYIPYFTPFLMMGRLAASPKPAFWEVGLSILVLITALFAVFWVAGRVFRVGVLMYGKPPRPREVLRWIREG